MPTESRSRKKLTFRISFIFGVASVSLSLLLFRMAYLQINKGASYRSSASTQQVSYIPVLPERGKIYDSHNKLLAYDVPSMDIVMTRLHDAKKQSYKTLATILAPVFKEKASEIENQMKNKDSWSNQVYLKTDASEYEVSFIQEHADGLPGISLVVSSKRTYPQGNLAGQILGYVGPINADEKKKYVDRKKDPYLMSQIVGQSGLELQYESYLQGTTGRSAVIVNNRGVPVKSLGLDPPAKPGDNLQLTLDSNLQAEAQKALASKIDSLVEKGQNVEQGAAVAIDPKTGAVLAMVSYPYLDPNWYLNPKEFQKHVKELNTFPSPVYDNASQGLYMPGSTVKPGNLLLGLMKHIITPTTTIDDNTGSKWIGDYLMHGDGAPGIVDPVTTIELSDDIYMYTLALWMSDYPPADMKISTWLKTRRTETLHAFYNFEKELGLGVKTGIDLPYESVGQFGDTGQLYDLPAAAIGQKQAFTPLQLADYAATIANDGKRMQLHLVKSINSPSGKVVETIQPTVLNKVSAPQEYWDVLHQGMYLVANGSRGTAYSTFSNSSYKVAGKTGTAQQGGGKNDISVFISYAPYDNPQIATAVILPGAGFGADSAAPVTKEILDAYFKEHHEFFPASQWIND